MEDNMEEKKPATEKKEKKGIEIVEIPTQTAEAFRLPTGEDVGLNGLLVFIANKLIELEKKL